jgi:ABC-type molybdate transport system substrate-binding protein
MRIFARAAALGFAAILCMNVAACADEIRVMISAGFFSVYKELGPAFEKSTGHKLVTIRGPSVGDSPEAIPTVWPVARRPTS